MGYFWYSVRVFLGLLLRRPLVGTCIIPLTVDDQIVLIRRRDSGRWGLPGGLIDWDEDVFNAARRELREETGLEVTHLERLVGIYSAPRRDPRFHAICVLLAVRVQGTPIAADPREVLETRAFSTDSIPQDQLSHDHRQHIQDFLQGKTVVA